VTKELQEFITRDRKITSAEDLQARISNLREQFGSAPDEKARCSAAWFEYRHLLRAWDSAPVNPRIGYGQNGQFDCTATLDGGTSTCVFHGGDSCVIRNGNMAPGAP